MIHMSKKVQRMDVLAMLRPEDVLPHITRLKERREYVGSDGRTWNVKMWSDRYFTFRESLSCVVCGLKGTLMSLERDSKTNGRPHFNLYAEVDDGLTLMTKDHIEPKSRGGKDSPKNFQTMCSVCNTLKASHRVNLTQMIFLRNAYDTLLADGKFPKKARRIIDEIAVRISAEDKQGISS